MLCWKDLDGYDLIVKSAKTYKSKHKSQAAKKMDKQEKKEYLVKQANRVVKAFKHWLDLR